jgi:hypothetical protein
MTIYYGYEGVNNGALEGVAGIDPDLLALMNQPILVENVIANPNYVTNPSTAPLDGYGRHVTGTDGTSDSTVEWGPAAQYLCRLEYETKVLASINGRDLVSSGRAYLNGFYLGISTESRVTLPNVSNPAQKHPVIMYVENNYDENGLTGYNTVLHFE